MMARLGDICTKITDGSHNPPQGISHSEYLMLDETSPIKVAQYYTQLPDKKLLAEKLQRAIAIAREHFVGNK